jgi:ABC-type polysaccharide/polyol phosphate export permease
VLASLVPVVRYPLEIWQHRYLVHNFFRRELLGRFRGSSLGLFWVLVHPIVMFAVYYLVFGVPVRQLEDRDRADPRLRTLPVQRRDRVHGAQRGHHAVVHVRRRQRQPRQEGRVPERVAAGAGDPRVARRLPRRRALVCLGVGVYFGVLAPGWSLWLLPVVLLIQFAMTLGIGLFLANAYVFARDTSHLWSIAATAWMFLTPVFWYPHALEGPIADGIKQMFAWNPAYPLLQAHRIVLGAQPVSYSKEVDGVPKDMISDLGHLGDHLLHASLWALVFLCLGYAAFMSRRHKYADLV